MEGEFGSLHQLIFDGLIRGKDGVCQASPDSKGIPSVKLQRHPSWYNEMKLRKSPRSSSEKSPRRGNLSPWWGSEVEGRPYEQVGDQECHQTK